MRDVVWGQYCLFLSVRIKDDLLDGQTAHAELLFPADRFLAEAVMVFSGRMKGADLFWELFWDLLERTNRGIVAVGELQCKPRPSPKRLAEGYADVSSIFKVGSAAVCIKAGRLSDLPLIEAYADCLAVVGQILDDLDDIEEDLKTGRYNYATAVFLKGEKRWPTPTRAVGAVARNALYTNRFHDLLGDLTARLNTAADIAERLHLPAARRLAEGYRRSLATLGREFHRRRVAQVFGAKYM